LFLSSALHCVFLKLLFIVCCTAFSIHFCLFTRGAMLLEIESAPLLEDEVNRYHNRAFDDHWSGSSGQLPLLFPDRQCQSSEGKRHRVRRHSQIVSDYGLILTVSVRYSVFFFSDVEVIYI